jgi:SAM-dependent MidA family methyltransferase
MRISTTLPRIAPPNGKPVPQASKDHIWQRITQEIRAKGRISYRDLMVTLSYDPHEGFYTKHLLIGNNGQRDHFTTRPLEFGPNYGWAFGRRFQRFFELGDFPAGKLDLVALGDGTGSFFFDILQQLKRNIDLWPRLDPTSIELTERFARQQQGSLSTFGAKVINDSALMVDRHLPKITGIVYANEMIDQFPAHKVSTFRGQLLEHYLTLRGDTLDEVTGPPSDPLLADYFAVTGPIPRDSSPRIVNLDAFRFLSSLAKSLERGFVFLIDYNRQSSKLHGIKHARFGRHVPLEAETVKEAIGRDVTLDVDFAALRKIAVHFGLEVLFEVNDYEFLEGAISPSYKNSLGNPMQVLALGRVVSRLK